MKDLSTTLNSYDEVFKLAERLSKSTLVPKEDFNKPNDVFLKIVQGLEVGLSPLQAVASFFVINGRVTLFGDAIPAIIKGHPDYEDMKEEIKGTGELKAASCTIKRKGHEPHTVTFSVEDAKKAGLWKKAGPWTQYEERMLTWRARGFCSRDTFPDALRGIISKEEAEDFPEKNITPEVSTAKEISKNTLIELQLEEAETLEKNLPLLEKAKQDILETSSMTALRDLWKSLSIDIKSDEEIKNQFLSKSKELKEGVPQNV